jgi:outer membrane lipoprotein SlyB
MKQPKWILSTMLLTAMSMPAQTLGGARLVQNAEPVVSPNHYYQTVATKRTVPKRRTKKKSAAIVGGSALGGAAIGGLAAGKKGAAIGALAGAGGGYVYDRKSQKKPVVPK